MSEVRSSVSGHKLHENPKRMEDAPTVWLRHQHSALARGITSVIFIDRISQFIYSSTKPRQMCLSPESILAKIIITLKKSDINFDGILGWLSLNNNLTL